MKYFDDCYSNGKPYKDFIGEHILGGAEYIIDKNGFSGLRFMLDGESYDVLTDPHDGYRSSCSDVFAAEKECSKNLPNVKVIVKETGPDIKNCTDVTGLVFIIKDDRKPRKPILLFGTDWYDNWYPYSVQEYTPENLSDT